MAKMITLPETEYRRLRKLAEQHELVRQLVTADPLASSPMHDTKRIIREFRSTGLYREPFLKSLERGLHESFAGRVRPLASLRELGRRRRR